MPITEIKPIRPTKSMVNDNRAKKIHNYATQTEKTQSVGMDRIREMMGNFKEKRK
ncbi:hypothetical protein [Paenibacillus antibioticophila]|uniref:hypothetical protein n=1 Tax=Paenibacillus antibioticophila TaxID=1274374 RepID=UPI000B1CEBCA|nr:hypothetical protein [Paenibacillus antibioticophila]